MLSVAADMGLLALWLVGWGYLSSGTLLLLYGRCWLELHWWFQYPSCTIGLPKFKDCEFPSCDFRFETGLMSYTNVIYQQV